MKTRKGYLIKRGKTFYAVYTIAGVKHCETTKETVEKEAKKVLARIMEPFLIEDRNKTLLNVKTAIERNETRLDEIVDNTAPLAILKAWDMYLASETRPRSGDETLRQYESHFDAFTRWLAKKHPEALTLRDITSDMAAGFVRHLEAERHLSGNRINKHVQLLRLFFKVLAKSARIKANPFADIAPRHHLIQSKNPLTLEQLKNVIETAEGELKTLFMLGIFAGLRLADAATLQWGEVDVHRRIIRRIPRKTARSGKAVIIGLPADFAAHLDTLDRRGPYILPETAAEYKENAPGLSRRIQKHLEACGIQTTLPGTGTEVQTDENGKIKKVHTGKRAVVLVGFHSLRHSFVSLHAQAGTPQAMLQKLAGHSNPMMTEHYTHLSDESALAMATAFPKLLAPVNGEVKTLPPAQSPRLVDAGPIHARLLAMTPKTWKAIRDELAEMTSPGVQVNEAGA
jgi:integrase